MSEISNKAIVIAVSLLVTIAITSSIITVIGYFKDIYAEVNATDISLRKMFNEYDMYDHTVMTGLDIENTYNKYVDDPLITLVVKEGNATTSIKNSNGIWLSNILKSQTKTQQFYATKYDVTCERIGDGATITFTRIR